MKSLILTFSLGLTAMLSLSAQGNIPQPTHYVNKIAPSSLLPLENSSEHFIYRDNNGHIYQTKYNTWVDGNWTLHNREYYTLNAEGRPTQIWRKDWIKATSTLVNAKRSTIGYHPNGLENYRRSETWNAVNGSWETQEIMIITFASNDKVKTITTELYMDGAVVFSGRTMYAYDAGDRISELIRQTRFNGAWTNDEKTDYVYHDADENYDESFLRYWDDSTSAWGDVVIHGIQTLTSSQRIVQFERWDGNEWVPKNRNTTMYDANGQKTEYVSEAWDGIALAWEMQARQEFAYHTDQSRLQFKYYNKDFDTEILYLYAVVDYDYGLYTVPIQTPALESKVRISPNPAADFVRVELEGGEISNITLLDLRGNVLVQTTTTANATNLSIVHQPAGTYFLRVEQGGSIKMLPVVKK